ncbi:MAG: hypothetical protein AAGD05_05175, partial [Bacteroidota bacterium]
KVQWDHTIGGDHFEELSGLFQTADGGFVFGGSTSSDMNGDVSQATKGLSDYWLGKVDADGQLLWEARYGGDREENMQSMHPTADGGYILGGWSRSNASGDKSEPNQGTNWDFDYWIVKTDANGQLEWDKTFGGPHHDQLWVVRQTPDGGYLLGGMSFSDSGEDKSEASRGDWDFWIVKTDANGQALWDRTYGGSGADMLFDFQSTDDGGYILAGLSGSLPNGDKTSPHYGSLDYWLVKINASGVIQWNNSFGGLGNDQCRTILPTSDGGFLLGGYSDSPSDANKTAPHYGLEDYWVVKTNALGQKIWDRSFGGSEQEDLRSVLESDKGIYILGGQSASDIDGTRTHNNRGARDYYLVFIDANGNFLQDAAYGGAADDQFTAMVATTDHSYLLGGASNSDSSGEKSEDNLGPAWSLDNWLVKLECNFDFTLGKDTTLCAGEQVNFNLSHLTHYAFEWNDGNTQASRLILPDSNSTYSLTITDIHGCTFADTIAIEYQPLPEVNLGNDTTLCQGSLLVLDAQNTGAQYLWSNQSTSAALPVNTSDSYSVTVTDTLGCSSSDEIVVDFIAPPSVDLGLDQTICAGEQHELQVPVLPGHNYLWSTGENTPSIFVDTTGTYSVTVSNSIGCSSTDDFQLQVNALPDAYLSQDTSICQGTTATLTFHSSGIGPFDFTYTDGQTFITLNQVLDGHQIEVSLTNNTTYSITQVIDQATNCSNGGNGISITVWPTLSTTIQALICEGDSIMLGGQFQHSQGIYRDTLTSVQGCDSLLITQLTVAPLPITTFFSTSCHPADTGTVITILAGQYCDSTIIEHINLLPTDTTFSNLTSCHPTDTGLVVFNLTNQFGCDSIIFQSTHLLQRDTNLLFSQSCNPIDTGTFIDYLTNANGCDSIVIENIQLVNSDTTFLFEQSCNPIDTGTLITTLNNIDGCDSLVIQYTQLINTDTTLLFEQSCNPIDTGTLITTLNNIDGCDSLVIQYTQLVNTDTTLLFGQSCNPIDTGTLITTLNNINGCDSLIIQYTQLINTDTTLLFGQSCNPIDTGTLITTLNNIDGCDSLIIQHTQLVNADTTLLFEQSCNPTDTGTLIITLNNIDGCDSLVIQYTQLVNADTTLLFEQSCNPIDTGTLITTLNNIDGCDSIVIQYTQLINADTTLLFEQSCNPIDTGTLITTLNNINGCDSLIIQYTQLVNADTTLLFEQSCNPIDTGMLSTTLNNIDGCDSLVILYTQLVNADTTLLFEQSCNPIDTGTLITTFNNIDGCDSLVIQYTQLVNADTTLL